MLINCIFVGIGGFAGSVMRYLMSEIPMSDNGLIPVNTLLTNVVGAFLIGMIIALSDKTDLSPERLLFLKVGVCGGFTTFSTFSLESLNLFTGGHTVMGAAYVVLSVILSIAAVLAGLKLMS